MLTGRWRTQRNWGCRISEGSLFGLRTITLENRALRLTFLLDKGADLVELLYKPQDLDLAWLTANGVKDPRAYANSSPDVSATFHDYYPGGWQEPFPNYGVSASQWGVTFGQHGEAPNLPWDVEIVEDYPESVAVRFSVRTPKAPFRLERTVSLSGDAARFRYDGRVTNESDVPLHAMWGHHITFGTPFLHPGVRITMPEGVRTFVHPGDHEGSWLPAGSEGPWPLLPATPGAPANEDGLADLSVVPPAGSPREMNYVTGFGDEGWYRVESDRHGLGAKVSWDAAIYPFVWHWHEYGANPGYFAYGRHYNIGLEPASSWSPNGLPGAIANGTAIPLPARAERTSWVEYEVYPVGSGE